MAGRARREGDRTGRPQRIWATLDPFVEGGEVLGRKVANTSFLTAFLHADPYDRYHFFLDGKLAATQRQWLAGTFPDLEARGAFQVHPQSEIHLHLERTEYAVFHLSDCLNKYVGLQRLRNVYSSEIFPITAPTHTLSYQRFMPAYLSHLWPGVSGRDAILATSVSARIMLERVFDGLEQGYGMQGGVINGPQRPRLEQIPLGVDQDRFPKPDQRWEQGGQAGLLMRERLGLGDQTVFLSLSRLSASSKMDMLPVISAFAGAVESVLDPQGLVLVLAGWVEPGDPLPDTLAGYAAALGVRLLLFPRPTDQERHDLLAAADCFLSMSDNIQETFGLTLAEAGLSGLPAIASDFDGYRDIVVDQETGLLIPVLGFGGTMETNLQAGLWYDNQYHLKLAQQTAVDLPALSRAIARLAGSPAVRRQMGEAARRRCLERYTWDAVIGRYLDLWERLRLEPINAEEMRRLRSASHPLFMDFGSYFRGHFSRTLDAEAAGGLLLQRSRTGEALYQGRLPAVEYAGLETMLDQEALRRILVGARRPAPAEVLLSTARQGMSSLLPEEVLRERASFALLWALKQGYLEAAGRPCE